MKVIITRKNGIIKLLDNFTLHMERNILNEYCVYVVCVCENGDKIRQEIQSYWYSEYIEFSYDWERLVYFVENNLDMIDLR